MPSATATKPAMAGTKRKTAPAKDVYVKENKKAKIGSDVKSSSKSKDKPKPILKPVQKVEEPSDSDSEDSDSDGGVPLNVEDSTSEVEENESEEEDLPKASDGLHPERAKAVVTNST
jgi:pumilio homology domain family member 6